MQWVVAGVGEFVNVHHMYVASDTSAEDPGDVVADMIHTIVSECYDLVALATSTNMLAGGVIAQNLTKNEAYGTYPNEAYGTIGAGQELPGSVTALIVLRTGRPGRQGRVYLPAVTESENAAYGQISVGTLAALVSFGAALANPLVGALGTYQRVVCLPDGTDASIPTGAYIPAVFRTQRRRTLGRGG